MKPNDKDQAREEIKKLTEKYGRLSESGKAKSYNEEMTKKDFILPLFRALGWAVEDGDEVTAEEKISRGRVDYAFRIDGIPKLFLEAKPLKADLDRTEFARQAINYAWHKGSTWAVLTDFEDVKVFNAELKSANPLQNMFFSLSQGQFLERFDQLWLLSRESLEQGRIDKEAEKWGRKAKKVPVDRQLLSDLTGFRELLTKNILKNNPSKKLTGEELDEAVQRILDRLIFIRTLEDRQLEAPVLQSIIREAGGRRTYKKLNRLFRSIDDVYDSRLFMPHLCDDLAADDEVLNRIIAGLFRTPDNTVHYDFSAIDADVLGNIYEQYLGHILTKTAKRARLTAGKAQRKEQGIYYTPTYIVDYIVKNTIGALAKKKNFDPESIKILDPACGSGSFLMKAFDYLVALNKRKNGNVDQTKLDLSGASASYGRKIEILEKNLFGVDLDPKAVEIAQLNLLLKAAEKKHRLPTLQENILAGNSLIDDPKIAGSKALNWKEEFGKILDEGGFDVVIGNPPYVRIQTLNKKEVGHYNKNYRSATKNYDVYALFVERGMSLLKEGGMLGFILPSKFFNSDYGAGLRKTIEENKQLSRIVDFKDFQVFEGAATYTCLLFLKKAKNRFFDYFEVSDKKKLKLAKTLSGDVLKKSRQEQPKGGTWSFVSDGKRKVIARLRKVRLSLADVSSEIFVGLQTSADPVYITRIIAEDEKFFKILCRKTKKTYKIEKEIVKPVLMGKDIRRWSINWKELGLVFPYCLDGGKASLIHRETLKKRHPLAWKYFADNKKTLDLREKGKWKSKSNWHAYVYEKNLASFRQPKILTQVLSSRSAFTLDEKGEFYFVGGGNAGGYGIVLNEKHSKHYYAMLAILNSKLLEFYLKSISTPFRGGFYSYGKRFIEKLPIAIPDRESGKKLEAYAKKQLSLNKRVLELKNKNTDEKTRLEKEIQKTESRIDQTVCKIYGLTKDEIRIVEESEKQA